jgi:hypothetical protein
VLIARTGKHQKNEQNHPRKPSHEGKEIALGVRAFWNAKVQIRDLL